MDDEALSAMYTSVIADASKVPAIKQFLTDKKNAALQPLQTSLAAATTQAEKTDLKQKINALTGRFDAFITKIGGDYTELWSSIPADKVSSYKDALKNALLSTQEELPSAPDALNATISGDPSMGGRRRKTRRRKNKRKTRRRR